MNLTDNEKAYAESFAKTISFADRTVILQYGDAVRKKVTEFSASSLFTVPTSDLNEMDSDIRRVMRKLKEFQTAFNRDSDITDNRESSIRRFRDLYDRFSNALTECTRRMEIIQASLLRHHKRMETLKEQALNYVREYDMYILAGEKALQTHRETVSAQMTQKAERSGILEDSIRAEEDRQACELFAKRLYDLSIGRALPLQTAAQIGVIQSTDEVIADSIRKLSTDTFSLYRNRVILALGLQESKDTTGKMIDPKLFKEANKDLMDALSAVLKIHTQSVEEQKKGLTVFAGLFRQEK